MFCTTTTNRKHISIIIFLRREYVKISYLAENDYLFSANKDNSTDVPVLYEYTQPLSEDVRYITHFYDCSCQVGTMIIRDVFGHVHYLTFL